jgi:hypothetical protein
MSDPDKKPETVDPVETDEERRVRMLGLPEAERLALLKRREEAAQEKEKPDAPAGT